MEIGHRRDLLRESEFIFEIGFTGTHVRARRTTVRLPIYEMDLGETMKP